MGKWYMLQKYFHYIARHYLKNFFVLLLGLSAAVSLIDYLQHASMLKGAANQKILYVFYKWQEMLALFYPLVIVFSAVWTHMSMIRQNTLIALFSFGYSKKSVFVPIFTVAVVIHVFFTFLQLTDFAYGGDKARVILHKSENERKVKDLFFKYNSSFVYVEQLDPVKKILRNTTIFLIKNNNIYQIVKFEFAQFIEKSWIANHAFIKTKTFDSEGRLNGFEVTEKKNLKILEGYKPRVIKLIYEGKSLRLSDGINAWLLLHRQGLDTNKVKASVYNKTLGPLFALAMIAILFFKIPPYQRFMRKEMVWTVSLGSTLMIWALLFALYRLGINGVISPDIAIPFPVALLCVYSFYLFANEKEKIAHPLKR